MKTLPQAELFNNGAWWSLRIDIPGEIHNIPTLVIGDDESPRDAAVREIARTGWRVEGDGSWWVKAWTGPEANRTWAFLERAQPERCPDFPDCQEERYVRDLAASLKAGEAVGRWVSGCTACEALAESTNPEGEPR